MQLTNWKRNHARETEATPYYWVDRKRPAGLRAHVRVWIERDVDGFDTEKWTVRKEQVDDDGRGTAEADESFGSLREGIGTEIGCRMDARALIDGDNSHER